MSLSEVSVGDIAKMKYGKMPPKDILSDEGFPVYSGYRVTGYAKECLYADPMLVVVARGVGGTGDVKISPPNSWITNLSIVLTLSEQVDQRYLFYKLGREALKDKLNTGAAQAQITIENLSPYKLKIHPLDQQKRIASILSGYDDLIENNRRRIALLEEAARQLYKEWFVHFRFPGHEHVPVVDGVPEGWAVSTMEEMAETVGGGTPSTKKPEYWADADITWFSPTDLTNNDSLVLLDSAKKINERGLAGSSAKMLPPETILMSSRASVGFFGLFDGEACTNQGFISLVPKASNTRMYLLFNLIHRREEIIGLASGATYKEINKSTFRAMSIRVPPEALLREFEELAYQNIRQVRLLMKSNANLKRARDLLLPKLMSGEIVV